MLVLSTAAPAATLASEPEQEQEGAAAPDQAAADEHESELPVDAPDPDPGWQEEPDALAPDTELPADQPPVQDTNDGEEPTVDVPSGADPNKGEEPADDALPVADPNDGEQPAEDVAPAPDAGTPAPVAPPAPEGATSPPAPPVSAAAAKPPIGTASSGPPLKSFVERPARERHARIAQTTAPAPAEIPTAAPEPSAPATVLVTARSTQAKASRAKSGDRVHVVAPGESLWSIASDLLGDDASVARTAREVNRLWQLNGGHIGTGDPDLLMVGTKLALR